MMGVPGLTVGDLGCRGLRGLGSRVFGFRLRGPACDWPTGLGFGRLGRDTGGFIPENEIGGM